MTVKAIVTPRILDFLLSFCLRLLSKTIGYTKFDFGCLTRSETEAFLEACHLPSDLSIQSLVADPLLLKEHFLLEDCFLVSVSVDSFLVLCKVIDLISYDKNPLYDNLFFQLKCKALVIARPVLLHRCSFARLGVESGV